jgi:hypothetical protein
MEAGGIKRKRIQESGVRIQNKGFIPDSPY